MYIYKTTRFRLLVHAYSENVYWDVGLSQLKGVDSGYLVIL